MKKETYDAIRQDVGDPPSLRANRPAWNRKLYALAQRFPSVAYGTLVSILSQMEQEKMRKHMHILKSPSYRKSYRQKYESGQSLLQIAEEVDFPPTQLARVMLEPLFLERCTSCTTTSGGTNRKLKLCDKCNKEISQWMKNVELIPDEKLRNQIRDCVEEDPEYSFHIKHIKHTIGNEYEYITQAKLRNARVPFVTEDELRRQGHAKTPDVKLEIPIMVNGFTVHWIDSKACFGDEYVHIGNQKQFEQYVNRFGTGLVIYWFDFIEELPRSSDYCLANDFPKNIKILDHV